MVRISSREVEYSNLYMLYEANGLQIHIDYRQYMFKLKIWWPQ